MTRVRKTIRDFYLERTYSLVKSFDRPFLLSLFLIISKHAQYFLLSLSPDIAERIQSLVMNAQYLTVIMYF